MRSARDLSERATRATATRALAHFASSLSFADIPVDVVGASKLHLLDTLGCGLASHGFREATYTQHTMAELGGNGNASIIGVGEGFPAANAAFANSTLCHALDFDDTHSDSICHVSVVACPAGCAVAEEIGASGRELMTAIVAATEGITRIGMASPGAFHERGFHSTSVCGIFGATIAACRLNGLDVHTTTNALGVAASMPAGIFAYLQDGSPTKPIHPGWASHGGILAARLADHGAKGPGAAIEGRFGLYETYGGLEAVDIASQLADLGERWETLRIAVKAFPACHYIHGVVGAASDLICDSRISSADIAQVVVRVPPEAVAVVLEPEERKIAPQTEYEAKFSLQYSTAAMLVHGDIDLSTYRTEAITDPAVLDLASRVRYETVHYETYPHAFPGGVSVVLKNGRTLEKEHLYQRGGPENPMTVREVLAKFRHNAAFALEDKEVVALEEAVLNIEEMPDVSAIFSLLRRVREPVFTPRG